MFDPKLIREVKDVLDRCRDGGLRLATVESCTGGLLAALLTDVEGRGHVFERGFVVYSDDAKCDLLGISRQTVETCGAVSEATAREMALGAVRRSRADIALAITGFAGPAGPGDEEGLVHFACAQRQGGACGRAEHFGPIGRQGVRVAALNVALELLEEAIRA